MTVNGQSSPVYDVRQSYSGYNSSYSYFSFSGSVNVTVTVNGLTINNPKVRPSSLGITPMVNGNQLSFTLTDSMPFKQVMVEPSGTGFNPLIIAANPLETNVPSCGGNVICYGPGTYNPGKITLGSNQTLYVAGGATVHAYVNEQGGNNITIRGRGILDGYGLPLGAGTGPASMLWFNRGSNLSVEGIAVISPTLNGTSAVITYINNTQNLTWQNIKLCNPGLYGVLIEDATVITTISTYIKVSFVATTILPRLVVLVLLDTIRRVRETVLPTTFSIRPMRTVSS